MSRLREEIKDITISKNKLIEEAHARIVILENDLQHTRNEKEENQSQNELEKTQLLSKIEQIRYVNLFNSRNMCPEY